MTLATSLVVLFNFYATADILTKFLQQCFFFLLLLLYLGNSQVSVYKTIGPTLVDIYGGFNSPLGLTPRYKFMVDRSKAVVLLFSI